MLDLFDHFRELAGFRDPYRALAKLELCPGFELPCENYLPGVCRDVYEAAAAGRQIWLLAQLRDVDVALEVDLQERQEGTSNSPPWK